MILESKDTQFKLGEDGQIFWQKEASNPMPGEAIGKVVKGETLTAPKVEIEGSAEDKEKITAFVGEWLERHVQNVLEPLFRLKNPNEIPEKSNQLLTKLFDALGILPREELESLISGFDEDQRKALRGFKIRMGPLLVFLPELNKPAAVRLRAQLLTLWSGKNLPAEAPADGIVSFSIEDKNIDKDYYRSIGYPVYGPRAIRVDMLDRVVCAVYDAAKDGKFEAQHQMAEWLGSNIVDLYKVLEAMGHVKTHDPLEEQIAAKLKAEEEKEKQPKEEKPEEEKSEEKKEPSEPQAKPELATFKLKRGKAIKTQDRKEKPDFKPKSKPTTKFKKPKPKGKPKQDRNKERVYKAEAKVNPDDSPFAILQQLKDGSKKS